MNDTFGAFVRDQGNYRRVFEEAHGSFPHPCYFCGELVEPSAVIGNRQTR